MGGQGDLGGPGSQKAIGDRCSDKERQTKRMTRRERTRGRRKLSRGARLQTHIPTPHPPPHTHTHAHTHMLETIAIEKNKAKLREWRKGSRDHTPHKQASQKQKGFV